MILKPGDAWADVFKPGTILWRPVSFYYLRHGFCVAQLDGRSTVDNTFVRNNDSSDLMAKVRFNNNFFFEPEVVSPQFKIEGYNPEVKNTKGFVVYVNELPPDNWTHLVVKGVSTMMRSPREQNAGGAIFCGVPAPYKMKDYLIFRGSLASAFVKNVYNSINDIADQAEEYWPAEVRRGTHRTVFNQWSADLFEYVEIDDEFSDAESDDVEDSTEEAEESAGV